MLGPPQLVQVERERAGGEGVIGGGDAGETERYVVGYVQPGCGAAESLRLVLFEPEQFAQAEDRLQREAGYAEEVIPAERAVQPLGLGLGRVRRTRQ
jgi:hypothetical protein